MPISTAAIPLNRLRSSPTVAELPKALLTDEKFGLHLRGWSAADGLRDEPLDDDEPALSVRLRIDESLEPTWAVITDRNPQGLPISARDPA